MTAVSDAVVIGVVLGLVFAAVSYYLFSRISQLERKVSFMETILLELKVTTEQTLLSATETPSVVAGPSADDLNSYHDVVEQATRKVATEQAVPEDSATTKTIRTYTSVDETEQVTQPMGTDIRELLVEPSPPRARGSQETVQVERERESSKHSVGVNFEAMTYKELQQYARDKGISGIRNLSKKEVIEIFRRRENTSNASSSATSVGSTPDVSDLSSWKQSSAQESVFQPLQDTEELGGMVGANEDFAPLSETDKPINLESMD
jgi:hypothetical protein